MDYNEKIYIRISTGEEWHIGSDDGLNETKENGIYTTRKDNVIVKEYIPYPETLQFYDYHSASEIYELFMNKDLIIKCNNGEIIRLGYSYGLKRIFVNGGEVDNIFNNGGAIRIVCRESSGYVKNDYCLINSMFLKEYTGRLYQSTLRKTYLERIKDVRD